MLKGISSSSSVAPAIGLDSSTVSEAQLPQLIIPDAVPVPECSDLHAVGRAAINDGLKVFVEPYQFMAVGDSVFIHWGGKEPATTVAVTPDNVNRVLGASLPESLFRDGSFEPYYQVKRVSELIVSSFKRDVVVKTSLPGGPNPTPDDPANENLKAPGVPDDVAQFGVDADRAREGVEITIAPYPNMAAYDRIDFSWGGQRRTETIQPTQVGTSITFVINEAEILAAGDGEIVVVYQVVDVAANRSDGWSERTAVNVFAAKASLAEPLVKEAVDGVVDLAALNHNDVTVQVAALGPEFAEGDIVNVTWDGRTPSGTQVSHTEEQVFTSASIMEFAIPFEKVAAIAQGHAVVSFVLRKAGSGPNLPSKRTLVQIRGEALALDPPHVPESSAGTIDAALQHATVQVQPYAGMTAGDFITMVWAGRRADGGPTDHRQELLVSSNDVGRTLSFTVNGPEHLLPLAGGQLQVYYILTPLHRRNFRTLAVESKRLTLQVSGAAATLPAPRVDEAVGGQLSPDLPWATVVTPASANLARNDIVVLSWRGNVTGQHTNTVPVGSALVGKEAQFRVDEEHIRENQFAFVSYAVHRAIGGRDESTELAVKIGHSMPLQPPTVDGAFNATLSLADVPEQGAVTRVAAYSGMATGDVLQLVFATTTGEAWETLIITDTDIGRQIPFRVPKAHVEDQVDKTINVYYRVTRANRVTEESQHLGLTIVDKWEEEDLLAPSIDEVMDDVLEIASVPKGATARVKAYLSMTVGDQVAVMLKGTADEPSWNHTFSVTADQVDRDLTTTIPLNTLHRYVDRTGMLGYTLVRAGGGTPVKSPDYAFAIVNVLDLAPPAIAEAGGDSLSIEEFYRAEFVTLEVPQYIGMSPGQTVRGSWVANERYHTEIKEVGTLAPLIFEIPRLEVIDTIGRSATVSYTVKNHSNSPVHNSTTLTLHVDPQALDLREPLFSSKEQAVHVQYPGMSTEHTVRVRWSGAVVRYSEIVPVQNPDQPLIFPIPSDWISENYGGRVIVNYTVHMHDPNVEHLQFSRLERLEFPQQGD